MSSLAIREKQSVTRQELINAGWQLICSNIMEETWYNQSVAKWLHWSPHSLIVKEIYGGY